MSLTVRLVSTGLALVLLASGCSEQETSEKGGEAAACESHADVASCLADEKCGWRTDQGACTIKPKNDTVD